MTEPMTVGKLREILAEQDDETVIAIGLEEHHLFAPIRRVQLDAFPDTPTVILWPELPPKREREREGL